MCVLLFLFNKSVFLGEMILSKAIGFGSPLRISNYGSIGAVRKAGKWSWATTPPPPWCRGGDLKGNGGQSHHFESLLAAQILKPDSEVNASTYTGNCVTHYKQCSSLEGYLVALKSSSAPFLFCLKISL